MILALHHPKLGIALFKELDEQFEQYVDTDRNVWYSSYSECLLFTSSEYFDKDLIYEWRPYHSSDHYYYDVESIEELTQQYPELFI